MRIFTIFFTISIITSACNEPPSSSPAPKQSANPSGNVDDNADEQNSRTPRERQDPRFYKMTGERPDQVCGEAGFEYLWRGFLLKECGTCHYDNNNFNVTPFAERRSLESSYQVMVNQVDKEELVHAVTENPLCLKCILHEEDPLKADIKFYAANPSSCPGDAN